MSFCQRQLTAHERNELDTLNADVAGAILARRAWLDVKMVETSPLKVGDDIYNLETGDKLGTITKLYRFWRDRDNGIYDANAACDYEYRLGSRIYDNTSSQLSLRYGSLDDLIKRKQYELRSVEGIKEPK